MLNFRSKLKKTAGRFITWSLVIFSSLFIFVNQAQAQTTTWTGVCVSGPDHDVATIQGLQCLIANIFTVFITLLGLAGFVMFLIAGLRWLTSGGNAKGMETARHTMTFAVVGLVVALSAFIVINLLADFTGVNIIRKFVIPDSTTQW